MDVINFLNGRWENFGMLIRSATKTDLKFIYDSLKDLAFEENISKRFSLTEEKLFTALFSEAAFAEVILVDLNAKSIGLLLFSLTNRNFDLFPSPGIYVHNLYIQPEFRKQGFAKALVTEIKRIARERNCSRIDWVVLNDNIPAINFYRTIEDAKVVDYLKYMRITLD